MTTLLECGCSPAPCAISAEKNEVRLALATDPNDALTLTLSHPRLTGEQTGKLARFVAAAIRECLGFTADELEMGVVSLMTDISPGTNEWLAACHQALGSAAFFRLCPFDSDELLEFRDDAERVLPLMTRKLERDAEQRLQEGERVAA